MPAIFISYRREDCPAHAGRLFDALSARFGADNVFMDVDTIDLGVDFVTRIEQAVGDCDVVLALIGEDWLTVKDRQGRRRLDRPEDFVRLEICHGLAREDVRVIPVLVEGAEMPTAADLPEDLVPLTRRNGVSLNDAKWRSDTAILIGAIEAVVGARVDRQPPPDRRSAAGGERLQVEPRVRTPWSCVALCGFAGVWFVFTGLRMQRRRLIVVGALYAAVAVGLVLLLIGQVFGSVYLFDYIWFAPSWVVCAGPSAVHYFAVRPRYEATAGTRR